MLSPEPVRILEKCIASHCYFISMGLAAMAAYPYPVAWAEEFPGKMTWLPFVPKSIGVDAK